MLSAIEFWEFCERVLKIKLTLGQRVVAKVAFGDHDPEDLDGEEHVIAREMFGGLDRVPQAARKYIILRLGRGSGKTTLCAAYAVYQAVTHDLRKLGPGDVGYVITVAPDKETAKLSIRMAREMIHDQPALERLVTSDTDTQVQLRRPDGKVVRIEAFAATKGGKGIRGRTIVSFLLDEAEFFASNSDGNADYAVNDRDIFRALKPRLLRSGKGMLVSTPWPVETLMGEMFDENWGNPKGAVAVKAPTILVRGDDPDIVAMVEDELARDPENARRELFCEVDVMLKDGFFDDAALKTSIDEDSDFPLKPHRSWPTAVACDFGFTRDSSAIVVVQYDGRYYRTAYIEELRPKPGSPLKPSEVVKKFAEVTKRYGCHGIVSDGYYREAIKEYLAEYNLVLIDALEGTGGKAAVYQRTRSALHEGRCRIPGDKIGRRLVQQAKMVTHKASPGGTVTIKVPRKIGLGHGDIVSAWTLAVHALAYRNLPVETKELEYGTPEWKAEFERRVWKKEHEAMAKALAKEEADVRRRLSRDRKSALRGMGIRV